MIKNKIDYPDPIRIREQTVVLNGEWLFSFDAKNWQPICVPFCPESSLSGIGHTDFIPVCHYKKFFKFGLDAARRTILHFGAVDYLAEVSVNGVYVGMHVGGYTPFSFDITDVLKEGENCIEVAVYDGESGRSASGKQSRRRESYGCYYTRVTGIWQSVWLESVPEKRIENVFIYPDEKEIGVRIPVCGRGNFAIDVSYAGRTVGYAEGEADRECFVKIPLSEAHFWSTGEGNLYDMRIRFEEDVLYTYFGLRSVGYEVEKFMLNGKPLFQRFVLDQGYYPDGVYTPRDVKEMRGDIERALDLGFNGARLHEKVFDPRFLYLCDRAGFMVWEEFAGWGIDYSDMRCTGQLLSEWAEVLTRDFNHPCVVTWCPLNETWGGKNDGKRQRDIRFIDTVYEFTKKFDTTRPCIDVSGGFHGTSTDLFDFHCYEDLSQLKRYMEKLDKDDVLDVSLLYGTDGARYRKGQAVNVSECGGWGFFPLAHRQTHACVNEREVESSDDWGYGCGESDGNAFARRYKNLAELLISYKKISGYCYTQLYDIEQEQNGFYRYDRSDKLTEDQKEIIRAANMMPAAIEKQNDT